ncbi:MAG: aminotransferase class I/II-fold pyridoxal phosphate-dependent enzyme [candidate division WOR-3 bacterium]
MYTNGKSNTFYFFKGRIALYAILKAMGVKAGDEVIIPGFTCVVVPNAVLYLGAKPVYVDIEAHTYNINTKRIEEKITEKTKAIIAQHTFGIPAEMDKILEIAKKHNLYVVEDSCHAIGSKYKDQEVGTFADAAFFSSQWSKPVTTGLGGWAIVNNPKIRENMDKFIGEFTKPSFREIALLRLQYLLYEKLLTPSLFWFAQTIYRKLYGSGIIKGSSSPEELACKMPGDYKKLMSEWQGQILQKKLKKIGAMIQHRKTMAGIYESHLKKVGLNPVSLPADYDTVFLRYPLAVKDKEKLLYLAKQERIELGDWFVSPVHPLKEEHLWRLAGYEKGMCPIAEEVCQHVINLPTHGKIKEKDAEKIVKFIRQNTQIRP